MMKVFPNRTAKALVSGILSAVFLLSSSCGKDGKPSRVEEGLARNAEIERPTSREYSGWFPHSGPDRLDRYAEEEPGSGLAILEMWSIDSKLLIVDGGGRLYEYSGESGRWIPAGGYPENLNAVSAAADEKQLYILDQQGLVYAFPADKVRGNRDGLSEPAWAVHPGMDSDWVLAIPGGIACASSDGKLAVLSASDGNVQAFRDIGLPLTGKPVAAGSILAIPRLSGLAALSIPNLEFLWSGDRALSDPPVLRTIQNILAYQGSEGTWHILDARTGTELYSIPTVRGSTLAVDGERWYIAGPDGAVGAFRITDGVPVWTAGAVSEGKTRGPRAALSPPRIALESGRLFVARYPELESWNSETGELIERTEVPAPVDGLFLTPGRLHCRMRGGTVRTYGSGLISSGYPDPESPIRPDPSVSDMIRNLLARYAEPESAVRLAWRAYVPDSAPSPDYRFTVFQYSVQEAGKKTFSLSPAGPDPVFIGVFDAEGSERYTNVGELGVDPSFEFWMEPGTWYIAVGSLRGRELTDSVFLEIR